MFVIIHFVVVALKVKRRQAWCYLPVIPALGRLRQEDSEFQPAWAIEGDPISKNTKQSKVKKERKK
jgi:hypothetical protein